MATVSTEIKVTAAIAAEHGITPEEYARIQQILGREPNITELGIFRDRKSTRLNSSHGYISYAVFCLKKKKKHTRTRIWQNRRLLVHRRAWCHRALLLRFVAASLRPRTRRMSTCAVRYWSGCC